MGPPSPRPEDLPDRIPVFPLAGALLLPGGRLPLSIFEPRYLAMVEDALAAGRVFGMIQPDEHRPAGPHGPALYAVGCLGRLCSFSETDDDRCLITLAGVIRFAVAEELPPRRGYRRVRADFSRFVGDLAPAQPDPRLDRPALLTVLHRYFEHHGFAATWDAIDQMADDALVMTLSMVCPFAAPEKQALLEAPSPVERAEVLLTLLQIDVHEPSDGAESPRPFRAS
jgi:Lon protease-like protein